MTIFRRKKLNKNNLDTPNSSQNQKSKLQNILPPNSLISRKEGGFASPLVLPNFTPWNLNKTEISKPKTSLNSLKYENDFNNNQIGNLLNINVASCPSLNSFESKNASNLRTDFDNIKTKHLHGKLSRSRDPIVDPIDLNKKKKSLEKSSPPRDHFQPRKRSTLTKRNFTIDTKYDEEKTMIAKMEEKRLCRVLAQQNRKNENDPKYCNFQKQQDEFNNFSSSDLSYNSGNASMRSREFDGGGEFFNHNQHYQNQLILPSFINRRQSYHPQNLIIRQNLSNQRCGLSHSQPTLQSTNFQENYFNKSPRNNMFNNRNGCYSKIVSKNLQQINHNNSSNSSNCSKNFNPVYSKQSNKLNLQSQTFNGINGNSYIHNNPNILQGKIQAYSAGHLNISNTKYQSNLSHSNGYLSDNYQIIKSVFNKNPNQHHSQPHLPSNSHKNFTFKNSNFKSLNELSATEYINQNQPDQCIEAQKIINKNTNKNVPIGLNKLPSNLFHAILLAQPDIGSIPIWLRFYITIPDLKSRRIKLSSQMTKCIKNSEKLKFYSKINTEFNNLNEQEILKLILQKVPIEEEKLRHADKVVEITGKLEISEISRRFCQLKQDLNKIRNTKLIQNTNCTNDYPNPTLQNSPLCNNRNMLNYQDESKNFC